MRSLAFSLSLSLSSSSTHSKLTLSCWCVYARLFSTAVWWYCVLSALPILRVFFSIRLCVYCVVCYTLRISLDSDCSHECSGCAFYYMCKAWELSHRGRLLLPLSLFSFRCYSGRCRRRCVAASGKNIRSHSKQQCEWQKCIQRGEWTRNKGLSTHTTYDTEYTYYIYEAMHCMHRMVWMYEQIEIFKYQPENGFSICPMPIFAALSVYVCWFIFCFILLLLSTAHLSISKLICHLRALHFICVSFPLHLQHY